MERHYFGLSTLLASVALLIWSIGETFAFPQWPNVSLGSNPLVSFSCSAGHGSYTVPSNSIFVVTDITKTNGRFLMQADGVLRWRLGLNSNSSEEHIQFNSGIRFDSNEVITCSHGSAIYFWIPRTSIIHQ